MDSLEQQREDAIAVVDGEEDNYQVEPAEEDYEDGEETKVPSWPWNEKLQDYGNEDDDDEDEDAADDERTADDDDYEEEEDDDEESAPVYEPNLEQLDNTFAAPRIAEAKPMLVAQEPALTSTITRGGGVKYTDPEYSPAPLLAGISLLLAAFFIVVRRSRSHHHSKHSKISHGMRHKPSTEPLLGV